MRSAFFCFFRKMRFERLVRTTDVRKVIIWMINYIMTLYYYGKKV